MKLNRKMINIAFVFVWTIFSIAYIANDIWTDFQKEQIGSALQSGYQQGVSDTVNQALTQAKNEKCEPFSFYNEKEQVQLININCLQQPDDK